MSKRANSIADLRKHSTGEWTVVDADTARPPIALAPAELAAALASASAEITTAMRLAGAGAEMALSAAPLEHDEQAALFAWADAMQGEHPELAMLLAIPNGGHRHPAVAAQLKAEGVKVGAPDVALFCKRGKFGGLFIEMKRADHSNGPTPAQKRWIERLRFHGYAACICYGAQEAISTIMAYLQQEG